MLKGRLPKADSVGGHLVAGAVDTLSARETREKLNMVIDELGQALAKQAMATRDTLLGEYTRIWIRQLKQDLLGAETAVQVGALRDGFSVSGQGFCWGRCGMNCSANQQKGRLSPEGRVAGAGDA